MKLRELLGLLLAIILLPVFAILAAMETLIEKVIA